MKPAERLEHGSAAEGLKWSYDEAFSRNLGLISRDEQRRLRDARVAIAGMGGVGGVHLATLARLGVGRFTIADPDTYQTVNFNRQYGAMLRNLGRGKAESMAEEALQINPDIDFRVFHGPITPDNIGEFLDGASVVLDGVDFFAFDARRLLFREARRRGLWALTAGPLGFSAAWLLFDPHGMDFDTYFDLHDGMELVDQATAYAIGLCPAGTHWPYLDLSEVDIKTGRGPSNGRCLPIMQRHRRRRSCQNHPWPQTTPGSTLLRAVRRLSRRASARTTALGQSRACPAIEAVDSSQPDGENGVWKVSAAMLESAPDLDAACETLLQAAIRAPSGDDRQPWRFAVDSRTRSIAIHLDESRDTSPMNSGQRMARLAIGAALENMLCAADGLGWTVKLDAPRGGALATLRIENSDGTSGEIPPAILSRCTNRRVFDGRPLADDLVADLEHRVVAPEGLRIAWIHQRKHILSLADIIGKADALMLSEPSMRRAFLDNIRFDVPWNAEVDEGLSVASLELSAFDRIALRTMRHMPNWLLRLGGAAAKFAAAARRLVASSAGICILTETQSSVQSELQAGRALQRAWLALEERGIAVQPQMSIAILESVLHRGSAELLASLGRELANNLVREFRDLVPELGSSNLAFLMRFGYAAPPTARSGRLKLTSNVYKFTS